MTNVCGLVTTRGRLLEFRHGDLRQTAVMATALDETAKNGLRRFESLQAGLDLIDQGFTLIDADLQLLAWNEAFIRLLDFPREMVYLGTPFEHFIRYNAERGEYGPGAVDDLVAERIDAARRMEGHEFERTRPDGRVLRIRGVPVPGIGFVTLYSDVTEQRRSERIIREHAEQLEQRVEERTAELHRSRDQLRLITDSIPALVAYVDSGRRYRYANRGYREWFGLDLDRPAAISAREFLGSETFETIRPFVSRAFAGEAVSFDYDITRIDGVKVRARTSLVPDRDPQGTVAGCYELTFDITEQLKAQEMMLRAQKMEVVGQLTGGLAHDFNNLLTVVIGNLGLLARERAGETDVGEYVEPALQAARRGADIVKRLLMFARQQPLHPIAVDVAKIVLNVARIGGRSLPESLQLQVTGAGEPSWAWLDATALENALLNLLLNARDATAGNGQVRIDVASQALDAPRAGALDLPSGRYVRVAVTDNGCGMDAQTLRHIYEPFFTTKPPGTGTGLGMAMVRAFVEQSRGAIDVQSAPDEGTTVTMWLPACEAPDDESLEFADVGLGAAQAQGLALLVEDDAGVRRVVRRQLLELGFTVLEAENGVEGREILERAPGIALLLTDDVMPGGVDGRTLAREARDRYGIPRVLLMSGHAPNLAALTVPLLGKPFSKSQLAAALAAAEGVPASPKVHR